ncbi:MAG TPA: GNAT family N-acetyltransferase [Thermoleophilaceae bacterium]|nr:GNAT family N-acetyltransferase [Thermoleophilaceae bacterium]
MIRLARPEDADDVVRLLIGFRDWWGRDDPPEEAWRRGVPRLLANDLTDVLLGGGDPPTGVAVLRYRHSLWWDALDCNLEDLFVEESARRTGLGEELVVAAIERAAARGCARVELDVNESNAAAVALYEKLGFTSFSSELGGHNRFMRHYIERRG